MAIKEIPKSYIYICDGCKKEHIQENANGHYANSRPKYWGEINVLIDAYDYQGAAVADGSVKRLLCTECFEKVAKAINTVLNAPR